MPNFIPIETPIHITATFMNPLPNGEPSTSDRGKDLKYSREENPTVRELERKVAELDGFGDSLAFSSGMAAISTLLLSKARKGVIVGVDAYPTTISLALDLRGMGFRVKLVPVRELVNAVSREWGLVFVETITNPMLRVPDLPSISDRCEESGVELAVDNTFASPILLRPGGLASYSVQSATKYLAGHNDVIAGVLSSNDVEELWEWRRKLGTILDPFRAFLVLRGLQTLELRVKRHSQTALEVAKFLEGCDLVEEVRYPGLESHPDHRMARELFRGMYGGVVTFVPKVDPERMFRHLRVVKPAPSLGAPTSLISRPLTSASSLPLSLIRELGISERTVRLSVGLEDPRLIIDDLGRALELAHASSREGEVPSFISW